jgi:hypothetical protein
MTSQQLVVEFVALRGLSTEPETQPFASAYRARHASTPVPAGVRVRDLAARCGIK